MPRKYSTNKFEELTLVRVEIGVDDEIKTAWFYLD